MNRDQLALAGRQPGAALADLGVEALWQRLDHLERPHGAARRPHLGLGGLGPPEG